MSKESKALKERMFIQQAITTIKRQLDSLEKSRKKYLDAAKTAKLKGIDSQYNLAKSAIRTVTTQKTVLEQMLLNIEISSQMKDVGEMTKNFADGMQVLSGEIVQTATSLNFDKAQKQMNKAVIGTEMKNMQLDNLLDSTAARFESMSSSAADDELDKLINEQITATSDDELSKEIDELEKKLGANSAE